MFVLEVLVAVAVLAAVALAAAGRFDGLAEEEPDDPDIGVPADRPLLSTDVPRLRFRLAIRGYRMSDVDAARMGLKESVMGRLNEVGGRARLFSSAGAGTTVVLEVPK